MTDRKHTVELTLDQMEYLFAFINSAQVYHREQAEKLKPLVGVYDMSLATVDLMAGHESLSDRAREQWLVFYQIIRKARAAEKGGEA